MPNQPPSSDECARMKLYRFHCETEQAKEKIIAEALAWRFDCTNKLPEAIDAYKCAEERENKADDNFYY